MASGQRKRSDASRNGYHVLEWISGDLAGGMWDAKTKTWFLAAAWLDFSGGPQVEPVRMIVTGFFIMFLTLLLLAASTVIHNSRRKQLKRGEADTIGRQIVRWAPWHLENVCSACCVEHVRPLEEARRTSDTPGNSRRSESRQHFGLHIAPTSAKGEPPEDKATGIFTSTATIHGGQETTILTALVPLVHLGMVFVGTPYGQNPQIRVTDGIGGSPYGPGTLAGTDGSRQPVEAELTTARNLGSRLARVAGCLKHLRASHASAP